MDTQNKKTDNNTDFLIKKTEKLVTALYMITSFLNDSEPIKNSLRTNGIKLLSYIHNGPKESSARHNALRTIVHEMISLLQVSEVAGLLSTMNVSVLRDELKSLLESLVSTDSVTAIGGTAFLKKDFFAENKQETSARSPIPTIRPNTVVASRPSVQPTKVMKNVVRTNAAAVNRRTRIIDMLRSKGEIGVKDVAKIITDCSEKTLQRELLALVAEGVAIKRGERRWSTYRLA